MTLRWVWLTAFEHTRRGLRPWRTFGTNVCCFLPCQTFVPNVRHGVLARHDAYVLWVRPLVISEGLRPSVNMQWDLSEVLLGATPSQYKNVFAACWSLHVGTFAACWAIHVWCSQLADALHASLHVGSCHLPPVGLTSLCSFILSHDVCNVRDGMHPTCRDACNASASCRMS